jgi:quercetin dioxygenase-like cupin family protein
VKRLFVLVLLLAIAASAQTRTARHPAAKSSQPLKVANDVTTEPHHKIVFENPKTRVFRLDLPAGASTDLHTHTRDYLMIALTPVHAANTFDKAKGGSESNAISMSPGEIQVIKVPQTAKLVNQADAPMSVLEVEIPQGFHPDLIVCGMGKRQCPSDVGDISDPAHQFSIDFLFETDAVRVRDLTIGPGATMPSRTASDDFLRVAITPLDLTIGDTQSVKLNVGDVQWTRAGDIPKMFNNAKEECRFYEIEFK